MVSRCLLLFDEGSIWRLEKGALDGILSGGELLFDNPNDPCGLSAVAKGIGNFRYRLDPGLDRVIFFEKLF